MGKSSKDKRDAYYRLAKEQGWRARSAFKLIQLDEQFNLFQDVHRVVDLCAAPGSWSQVLSRVLIKGEQFGRKEWEEKHQKLRNSTLISALVTTSSTNFQGQIGTGSNFPCDHSGSKGSADIDQSGGDVRIVSVDLQPMSPLEGVTSLVGDITHPTTIPRILQALDPDTFDQSTCTGTSPVDLVVSDGAPDVTGLHDLDIYVQAQLLFSALSLAIRVLKTGGTFVAKIFRAKDVDLIHAQLRCLFKEVLCAKPRSSRASSLEAFIVCRGFELPRGYNVQDIGKFKIYQETSLFSAGEGDEGTEQTACPSVCVTSQPQVNQEDAMYTMEFAGGMTETSRWIAPFVACGDLSTFDSDATYQLPRGHIVLNPVQPPTAPPYARALEMRKQQGGFYGKIAKGQAP